MTDPAIPPSGARDAPSQVRAVTVLVELAPVALVIVAEAAWISVVAGLLQEFALRDPVLGIPAFACFVVAGIVLARLLGPRLDRRWPALAFALVLGAGVAGWLISSSARDALAGGVGPAFAAHPGGWLAGVAVLRGFANAGIPLAEGTVANLLAIGVPGLAIAAALGGLIVDPFRERFLADSLSAAIVYAGAAVMALALARLDTIGADAGFDWRRNPPWFALTIAMLVVAIVVAIPLASVAGTVITVALSVSLGPLFVIGLVTGFDRAARRVIGVCLSAGIVIFVVLRVLGVTPTSPAPATGGGGGGTPSSTAEQIVTISIGGFVLLATIVGSLLLIALWMRRTPPRDSLVGETRTIDPRGDGIEPRRRRNRFGLRPAPTTAVQAYIALVEDLERHADVRRDPAETPAAHAARMRLTRRSGLSLDLLAADYALARFGGIRLTADEDRRGVGRWRRLRRRLPIPPEGRPGRTAVGPDGKAPAPDPEMPLDLEPRRPF